jgi:hypothetical protein
MARAFPLVAALVVLASACDKPPVEWTDPVPIEQPAGPARLVVEGDSARFVADSVTPLALPAMPGRCVDGTVVAQGERPGALAAAWWAVRPDSSAVLYTAASADSGRTWGTTFAVDTTDVSSNGCRRPPASLATVAGDLYLAYALTAPEGTGVFFAHTMMGMVHSPVPVIYGQRIVATAIAADSQHVVVAYENPNGTRQQIGVSISVSQGHLFETHTTASRGVDNAVAPFVAFTDSTLAVSWLTRRNPDATPSRVVRVGTVTRWH